MPSAHSPCAEWAAPEEADKPPSRYRMGSFWHHAPRQKQSVEARPIKASWRIGPTGPYAWSVVRGKTAVNASRGLTRPWPGTRLNGASGGARLSWLSLLASLRQIPEGICPREPLRSGCASSLFGQRQALRYSLRECARSCWWASRQRMPIAHHQATGRRAAVFALLSDRLSRRRHLPIRSFPRA